MASFWSPQLIQQFSTSGRDIEREAELEAIEQKYKKLAAKMYKQIDMNYQTSNDPRYADAGVEPLTMEQLLEMKTEARWDIAW